VIAMRTPADDVHPVIEGCEAWSSPGGGPHGALVLHGFTSNPQSMRGLAEAFAVDGFAVELPRLPGHGTHVDDMVETTWDDWLAEAQAALGRLVERCPEGRIVVAGLSMGGSLATALAQGHPGEVAGLVLINAAIETPPELAASLEAMIASGNETIDAIGGDIADPDSVELAYDQTPLRPLLSLGVTTRDVRARLGEITCPALIMTSPQDHVVNPGDSDILAEELGGPVERITLENSYHVATLDHDRELIAVEAVRFAERVTGQT
jgi:carboxylesterase